MVTEGKISDPKKKKTKQVADGLKLPDTAKDDDYVVSKSGKPVKKAAKGLTFQDLQGAEHDC